MAYNLKGAVYEYKMDRDRSLEYRLKALELMPNDPQLNMLVGRVLVERRENMDYLIKGFTCLRKSIESLPKNDPEYLYQSGDFYFWLAEYPLAGKNYLESTRGNEGFSCPAWLMYFHVLTIQGKFKESAAFMDSVCAIQDSRMPRSTVLA
jgi:tetratricopeptide (TPR) repeat protein